jgi:hypothetical protein
VVTDTSKNNALTGEGENPTFSVDEAEKRRAARRKKLLETKEVEADAYTPKKDDTSADGDKTEQNVHDEVVKGENYPFGEGQ